MPEDRTPRTFGPSEPTGDPTAPKPQSRRERRHHKTDAELRRDAAALGSASERLNDEHQERITRRPSNKVF